MTFNRIVFIFGLALVLTVSISAILTKPVGKSNTRLITAVYRGISKDIYRGSVSYDLYLEGNPGYYKITANNSACFAYTAFVNKVSHGQTISVYLNNNTIISKPFVVCVVANGEEYLSFDCVNQNIANDKIRIPLLSVGAFALIIIIVRIRNNRNQKKEPKQLIQQ